MAAGSEMVKEQDAKNSMRIRENLMSSPETLTGTQSI